MDKCCLSAHCIDRESARIAEHVEQTAAVSVVLEQAAVVALVNKKTGFLSFEPVDPECKPVFYCSVAVVRAYYIVVLRIEMRFVWQSGL